MNQRPCHHLYWNLPTTLDIHLYYSGHMFICSWLELRVERSPLTVSTMYQSAIPLYITISSSGLPHRHLSVSGAVIPSAIPTWAIIYSFGHVLRLWSTAISVFFFIASMRDSSHAENPTESTYVNFEKVWLANSNHTFPTLTNFPQMV